MTLNGTLIVQIFNFIIAYFLIDRLLLRRAVALIQDERWQQDTLMKDIQAERIRVSENELQKKTEWKQFQKEFEKKAPKIIERPSFKKFERSLELPEKPSSTEVKHAASALSDLLIEKVTHVSS